MLMLVLMSMLMSHTSLHFFVSYFVVACPYVCAASVAPQADKLFVWRNEYSRNKLGKHRLIAK